jgi:hypothetical protein
MRMKRKLPETKKEEGQKTFQREWNKIYKQVDELRQKKIERTNLTSQKLSAQEDYSRLERKKKNNQQKMTQKKVICSF